MHLLQTTMWTATVYDHIGISLEYINLRHCHRLSHRLKIVLLRHYRCLRRSRMISKVQLLSNNILNKSKSTNRRSCRGNCEGISHHIYINSSESILVHRRTRLRDAYKSFVHCTFALIRQIQILDIACDCVGAWYTWWYCFIKDIWEVSNIIHIIY